MGTIISKEHIQGKHFSVIIVRELLPRKRFFVRAHCLCPSFIQFKCNNYTFRGKIKKGIQQTKGAKEVSGTLWLVGTFWLAGMFWMARVSLQSCCFGRPQLEGPYTREYINIFFK